MDSFTLTISHLQSPIFYLATVAAGSNLRPPFSIFDLTSGADGWALGSTICILHLLSPHFGPCCCSAICNPQSQSSIFSLEWGTGLEGSTGETWACPCERSARISSLNLLSLPQRSPVLAQRCPLLLVVEHRPPTRPSSERVRRGSRTGPAAVPWTQKLAPAEHSRLDPRPWPPRRAPGPPQERRQRRWCSATTPSRRSRIWRATGRRSPAPEDEDGRNGPGRALGGSVSVSIL